MFAPLAQQPWAVWLDSCQPHAEQGRYDIISAAPRVTLQTQGRITHIQHGQQLKQCKAEPLVCLQQALDDLTPLDNPQQLPFVGGAIGYFAYDLARHWDNIPLNTDTSAAWPDMAVGIYDWAFIVDHQEQCSYLVALDDVPEIFAYWQAYFSKPPLVTNRPPFKLLTLPRANFDADSYIKAFERIQAYIREGDCYQVNLAQCFTAQAQGDAWSLYLRLRRHNPAPFAAFFNTPQGSVLSSSPERFLALRQGHIETRPIKGTRPRCLESSARDAAMAQELLSSAKDRAENVMIVDLLRNDLSKVCELGSVQVPHLFELERFAQVHHLVSTVTGRLQANKTALDLLRASFPGGSITGAPKYRAMQIIEELEPQRRGLYCGSIGYLGLDGDMDLNISIRTLIYTQQQLSFCSGGGIVADSNAQAEYAETFAKASALFQALNVNNRA